jgi:hypothetical protein
MLSSANTMAMAPSMRSRIVNWRIIVIMVMGCSSGVPIVRFQPFFQSLRRATSGNPRQNPCVARHFQLLQRCKNPTRGGAVS